MGKLRKAFTAIELMIVVAVLLILMGMLVPVISRVRRQAQQKLARTKLKGLKVAIERYYQELGSYPRDTGCFGLDPTYTDDDGSATLPSQDDPYSLYRFLCGAGGEGIFFRNRMWGPYITFNDKELRVDGAHDSYEKVALDPWGLPWVYEENWSHTRKRVPDQALIDHMHNFRYEIYSVGMNGQIEPALHDSVDNDDDGKVDELDEEEGADDITSWSY